MVGWLKFRARYVRADLLSLVNPRAESTRVGQIGPRTEVLYEFRGQPRNKSTPWTDVRQRRSRAMCTSQDLSLTVNRLTDRDRATHHTNQHAITHARLMSGVCAERKCFLLICGNDGVVGGADEFLNFADIDGGFWVQGRRLLEMVHVSESYYFQNPSFN